MDHNHADRPRILAIDDTPTNLMVLASAMTKDFVFQLATSGAEGLAMAQAHRPDLVLLDVMIPEMDGFETCLKFKNTPALADVPIVFVTALDTEGSEVKGLEMGAQDYLHKPVNVAVARQRIRNLVERDRLKRQLKNSESRLHHVIDATRLATWEWNCLTGEIVATDHWADLLEYTAEELKDASVDSVMKMIHPDDLELAKGDLGAHLKGETSHYDCEFRMLNKSGLWIWVHGKGKVIQSSQSGSPCLMFGTLSDITARKQMEVALRESAIRDPLTNVYNRRYLMDRMEIAMAEHRRSGQPMCAVMMDLDHFKLVNDTYGHHVGDGVLKHFTRVVQSQLRSHDLFGRYGGEEFVLMCTATTKDAACQLIQRIMQSFRQQPAEYLGNPIRMTFSSGIAETAETLLLENNAVALLKLADQRMYTAKNGGRDRCVIN
jgi:diguanylate cyclase (GGDEF)-like protein/PAS domain S-box-containing protein